MKSPTVVVGAALLSGMLAGNMVDRGASTPVARATRAPLEPVPYQFNLEELALTSRGRVLLRDGFDRAGTFHPAELGGKPAGQPYFLHMGFIDGSYVRNGSLNIDQSCSINPFENFAFDFSLPVDERGRHSFLGKELFGDLQFDARLIRPRVLGPEKFKIGLVDDHLYFTAAMISFEKGRVTLQRQGGEPRTITPFLETTFDQVDLTSFAEIDEAEFRLSIDATGRATSVVRIRAGGRFEAFHLSADAPWARLNPHSRYSAHVFVEDLAQPRIFSVYPESVSAAQVQAAGGLVQMKLFGIGFGEDSKVELVRADNGESAWARAEDIKVLMFNMGLETKVVLPRSNPGDYTVRIHTAGITASVPRGLRVLE